MGRTSRGFGWFLACLLACVVALGAAPGVARAEEIASGRVDEEGKLTWTLDNAGELVIEGPGPMPDFGSSGSALVISTPWSVYSHEVTSVTVGGGVISVGEYAFNGMYNLVSADLEEGVTSIGEDAFDGCRSLTSVELPSTLESIGVGAFSFSPSGAITREQAACVLHDRAAAAGEDVSARADLSSFSDAGDLSAWAEEAMSWAVAEGVFGGGAAGLEPGAP